MIVGLFLPCVAQDTEFPAVEGWTQEGEVRVYTADNLWEYINGAADLFVEYDVLTCRTTDLVSGTMVVTVDLYDMGTPLNAFGVYARERPEAGVALAGAAQAAISPPYQALLLKGSTYVKVNAVEGELTEHSGRQLLEVIARALPGEPGLPAELDLLPSDGRVAGSEGYQRRGFLGLSELNDCLHAEYRGEGGRTWQGFVVLPFAGASAESTWGALAGAWEAIEHGGHAVLLREIPYTGVVGVVRGGGVLLGVSGAADRAELLLRLDALTP